MKSSFFAELLARQQILILLRAPSGAFRPHGEVPTWYSTLLAERLAPDAAFDPVIVFHFLEHFLHDAEDCWRKTDGGELLSGIWTEIAGNGTAIPLQATACVVGGEHLLLIRRIETEFDQLHRALQKGRELSITHERLLAETSKKEILLHCIIHDLSGPLSGISGAMDILRSEPLSDDGRKFLELGRLAARQQANLIGDLLDSFRAELGSLDATVSDPENAPNVNECAREVLAALKPAFAVRGVQGQIVLAPGVPARVSVVGERNRLQRVLHNLLQNALRYSLPQGTVTVAIKLEDGHALIAVEDEGPGIPPDIAPQLFQKFVRGRGGSGKAGLGLFFCRITVEQWGGAIGCEPRAEGGTRFWFRLKTV